MPVVVSLNSLDKEMLMRILPGAEELHCQAVQKAF